MGSGYGSSFFSTFQWFLVTAPWQSGSLTISLPPSPPLQYFPGHSTLAVWLTYHLSPPISSSPVFSRSQHPHSRAHLPSLLPHQPAQL